MRALFFNASPKDDGATQEILNLLRDRLPEGWESESLCLGRIRLDYCLGEKACYTSGRCIHRDDMEALLEKIDAADLLIFAAPSYWADVPGQCKVFFDRCTPFANTCPLPGHRQLKPGKLCHPVVLRTGPHPEECEAIAASIRHWCGHMGVEAGESLIFCSVETKEDIRARRQTLYDAADRWFREK